MSAIQKPAEWVRHNPLTQTYDTPDGTQVAIEVVDNAQSLLDVFHVSSMRERQRAAKATKEQP